MAFSLPDLPYAHDALEPHVDARTMEIHHGKHHNAYVTNLNKALEGHDDLAGLDIKDLCAQINTVPEAMDPANIPTSNPKSSAIRAEMGSNTDAGW